VERPFRVFDNGGRRSGNHCGHVGFGGGGVFRRKSTGALEGGSGDFLLGEGVGCWGRYGGGGRLVGRQARGSKGTKGVGERKLVPLGKKKTRG